MFIRKEIDVKKIEEKKQLIVLYRAIHAAKV